MRRAHFFLKLFIWILKNIRIILSFSSQDKITIVSASDNTHQRSLRNLLESVTEFEPNAGIIVYDLGMDHIYLENLRLTFPQVDFKKFPYEEYPSYYDIKVDAGCYAWKPAILERNLSTDGVVIWFDAGNLITGRLTFLRKCISRFGFYSPYSIGTIEGWTAKETLRNLHVNIGMLNKKNLSANVIAFNAQNEAAVGVIQAWVNAAKEKEIIAPEGSSRENHRQDQSVLTIVAYQLKMVPYKSLGEFPRRVFKILVHQDAE